MRRLISLAAFAAFLLVPRSLAAQEGKGSVCTDGSKSTATGQGACSGHGGVDKAATDKLHKSSKSTAKKTDSDDKATAKSGEKSEQSEKPKNKSGEAKTTKSGDKDEAKSGDKDAHEKESPGKSGDDHKSTGKASNTSAEGATAKCKDGTYSHSKQHSGACSKHGGVAQWMDGTKSD